MSPLRLLTYLAPSIPRELFDFVALRLQTRTGLPFSVELETTVSGPTAATDPFVSGRADLAFVCGPSFAELRDAGSPVEIVAAAPVFDDPRNCGRPVYFSDVVVSRRHGAERFADLRHAAWSYNDRFSLSGWYKLLARLASLEHTGPPEDFFSQVRASGSHLASLDLVASGQVDASAVDSNTLLLERRRDPARLTDVRVLESWGPSPVQPLLARSTLDPSVKAAVASELLSLHEDDEGRNALARFAVVRFAAVDARAYADAAPV